MVRRYHFTMGEKKRRNIIVLNNAFHGRTVTGIQAGYNKTHREGFLGKENCDCGFSRLSMNEINILEKKLIVLLQLYYLNLYKEKEVLILFSKMFF